MTRHEPAGKASAEQCSYTQASGARESAGQHHAQQDPARQGLQGLLTCTQPMRLAKEQGADTRRQHLASPSQHDLYGSVAPAAVFQEITTSALQPHDRLQQLKVLQVGVQMQEPSADACMIQAKKPLCSSAASDNKENTCHAVGAGPLTA